MPKTFDENGNADIDNLQEYIDLLEEHSVNRSLIFRGEGKFYPKRSTGAFRTPLAALFMACYNDKYNFKGELATNVEPAYVYIFESLYAQQARLPNPRYNSVKSNQNKQP